MNKYTMNKQNKTKIFHYKNTEHKNMKTVERFTRKVVIKGGRGHKSVSIYKNGKKKFSVKKSLKSNEIQMIKEGKFIHGLFQDCK